LTALRPDRSYRLFGAESLLKRLQALTVEIDGVKKAEDIEFIHRMRVASRRTRAALEIFGGCFSAKKLADWERQIRRVTRALGSARDTDVQINYVASFLAQTHDPRPKPGVTRLLLRLRQRRARLQAEVLKDLTQLEKCGVVQDMEETLRGVLVQARLDKVPPKSSFLYMQASRTVMLRLEELLSYDTYVHQPESITQLHEMRIAAKHLRYTMEIFEPLYDGGLKKPLKTVRDAQEMLGDIHDCDVWVAELPHFLETEVRKVEEFYGSRRTFKGLVAGIDAVRSDRQSHRNETYGKFTTFWDAAARDMTWDGLRDVLQASCEGSSDEPTDEPVEETSEDSADR
jgi:CHAD domain-containing protein